MTAEEFLKTRGCGTKTQHGVDYYYDVEIVDVIAFAKYHVQEALKEALDSIPCLGSSTDIASYEEVAEAVLNSYTLENIK